MRLHQRLLRRRPAPPGRRRTQEGDRRRTDTRPPLPRLQPGDHRDRGASSTSSPPSPPPDIALTPSTCPDTDSPPRAPASTAPSPGTPGSWPVSSTASTPPRVTVAGSSLGGAVAGRYAADHPERISALVLIGSMGLVPVGAEGGGRIPAGATNQSRQGVAAKLRRIIHDPALVTGAMEEEEFLVNNSPGAAQSFATLAAYIRERLDADVMGDELRELAARLPVLLVWGTQDRTVPPAVGRAVQQLLQEAELAMVEDAAHTVYFEKPDVFNRLVLDFLAAHKVRP
ncbi:alpha/beta fold hydrolase [Streptomyces sp. NPDC088387]|uniref:alpha/beta fold hydrolase n=1 Tax=Streptomyces sp. NPDC088387 TaxID=3365859 RepID=UPI003810D8E4